MSFSIDHTPAEVVKQYPQASDLFNENKIDFCCGGDIPLKEQCEQHNIEVEKLISILNERYFAWKDAGNIAKDWDETPLDELIDHIIYKHHVYLVDELPRLSQFVTKVFRVHGSDHPHLQKLYRLFHEFKMDMEQHMVKEEQEVFPLIKQYVQQPDEKLRARIIEKNEKLEEEHDDSGQLLKEIREITDGFNTPPNACGTYRVTYDRLSELEANTFQHVHLENNILFKRLAG